MNTETNQTAAVQAPASVSIQKVSWAVRNVGAKYIPDVQLHMGTEGAMQFLKTKGILVLADDRIITCKQTGLRGGNPKTAKYEYFMTMGDSAANNTVVATVVEEVEAIPTGEFASTEDETKVAYRSLSGTEILVMQLKKMHEFDVGDEDDEDDYDEDEEDDDRPMRYRKTSSRMRASKKPITELSEKEQARRAARTIKVTPAAYFQFVKSSFTDVQVADLTARLVKLQNLIRGAQSIQQTGLYESLAIEMSNLVREQQLATIGCTKRIPLNTVNYFMHKIEKRQVRFSTLELFPRAIPEAVQVRIREVQASNVFDTYHILFIDYTEAPLPVTIKEKVRIKDPILFGAMSHSPDILYHIIDWVDEYCDLTMDKMVDALQVDDPTFALDVVPELDEAYIQKVVEDVNKRQLMLKKSNPSNYRRHMRQLEQEEMDLAEEERERLEEQAKLAAAETPVVPVVEEQRSWFHGVSTVLRKIADAIG
jgi:hypothetical protein